MAVDAVLNFVTNVGQSWYICPMFVDRPWTKPTALWDFSTVTEVLPNYAGSGLFAKIYGITYSHTWPERRSIFPFL